MDFRAGFAHNVQVGWEMMKVGRLWPRMDRGPPRFLSPGLTLDLVTLAPHDDDNHAD